LVLRTSFVKQTTVNLAQIRQFSITAVDIYMQYTESSSKYKTQFPLTAAELYTQYTCLLLKLYTI